MSLARAHHIGGVYLLVCLPPMLSIARCSLNEPPRGASLFYFISFIGGRMGTYALIQPKPHRTRTWLHLDTSIRPAPSSSSDG
jgi:hypothetical protein